MQVHNLSIRGKSRKRVGRGGKRGTYSGRGCKGQKARSGGSVDPLFEGGRSSLVDRMKKLRGFTSPRAKRVTLRIDILAQKFKENEVVDYESLILHRLLRKNTYHSGVKIVRGGTLKKKLIIAKEIFVTKGAEVEIKKAGGNVLQK